MEKNVLQYNYQAGSQEEAIAVAENLRQLEGCLDARAHSLSACAHFAMDDQGISQEVLPDGCRIVPASIVGFLNRTGH